MRLRTTAKKPFLVHSAPSDSNPPWHYEHTFPGRSFDFFEVLHRRWILSAILFSIVLASGIAWTALTWQPTYMAEATIFVAPENPAMSTDAEQSIYTTFANQQILVILHYRALSEVIRRLRDQHLEWRKSGESERDAVDRLRQSIDVERIPNSYEIAIDAKAKIPGDAALIANTIAQTFINEQSQSNTSGQVDQKKLLDIEKARLTKELTDLAAENGKYSESLQVADILSSKQLPSDGAMIELRKAAEDAHRKRVEAEVKLGELEVTARSDAERIVSQDPATQMATAGLLQRKSALLQSIGGMLPSHPVRQAAEREIASIDIQLEQGVNDAIPKMAARLIAKARGEVQEGQRVENRLNQEIREWTSHLPHITEDLGQAELIRANMTRVRDRLSKVQGEMDALSLRSAAGDSIHIFSPAVAARSPIRRKAIESLVLALILAFVVAISIPLVLDLSDSRIYDPAGVESLLGFPVVGIRLRPSPKTSQFAAEHLKKLVSGIERGIDGGASSILLTGLKEPVPATLITEIWRLLSSHGFKVTLSAGVLNMASKFRGDSASRRLRESIGSTAITLKDREVLIMDAPALLLCAETERLALEADITLIVVQACKNTRQDLLRAARSIERIHVPAIGVILDNVEIARAGSTLRRDLEQYLPLQNHLARFTLRANDPANE